jgi:transposase
MDTNLITVPAYQPRRRHSPEFKAQAIAACLQPGVSIAAIALANQLNANYLRRWVKVHRDQQTAATPAPGKMSHESAKPPPSTTLVPITLRTPAPDSGVRISRNVTGDFTAS